MARLVIDETVEREIHALKHDLGISRYAALAVLGLLPGDVFGDGDLLRVRPLTDDERVELGLEPEPEEPFEKPSLRTTDK